MGYLIEDGAVVGEIGLGDTFVRKVSPRGLRHLGQWPSPESLAEAFPAILEALAAQAPNQEDSIVLRGVVDVVKGIGIGVTTAAIKSVTGM